MAMSCRDGTDSPNKIQVPFPSVIVHVLSLSWDIVDRYKDMQEEGIVDNHYKDV